MYEATKKQVYDLIVGNTEKLELEKPEVLSAIEVSQILNISRNLASQYLNDFVKRNDFIKISTRPVYFLHKKTLEIRFGVRLKDNMYLNIKELVSELGNVRPDVYSQLVGYRSGLGYQVEKCKAAMSYPPRGLPVLICGKSGTGKKKLAWLTSKYALENGYTNQEAIFFDGGAVYANADMALFGQKGGGDGYIERADGGILCIENAEELDQETRKKLFDFLNTGILHRHNEGDIRSEVNTKLIFISSCNQDDFKIKDFLNRIPIVITMPSLDERSDEERKELMIHFLREEALKTNREIYVGTRTLDILLQWNYNGNIDQLRDVVKLCCANAYMESPVKEKTMQIFSYHLPEELLLETKINSQEPESSHMVNINEYQVNNHVDTFRQYCIKICEGYRHYENQHSSFTDLSEKLWIETESYCDYLTFENKFTNKKIHVFEHVLDDVILEMVDKYYMHFPANFSLMFARCLYSQMELEGRLNEIIRSEGAGCFHELQLRMEREGILVRELQTAVEGALGISICEINLIFLLLNIRHFNEPAKLNMVRGIVICHGGSTASSMVDVANKVLGVRIFEAFDMPINVTPGEIIGKLKRYLNIVAGPKELILLVDMGSLEELHAFLNEYSSIHAGLINNVSTRLVLDVGSKILSGTNLTEIVIQACKDNVSSYKLVDNSKRTKAILFFSETGIQAARRMSELFANSLPEKLNVELVACEYQKLLNYKVDQAVFRDYEVLFLVGTVDPGIPDLLFVSMEDVISFKQIGKINNLLREFMNEDMIAVFNQNLVKEFSLQNVIGSLTILNADVLIDKVDIAIGRLQKSLGLKLNAVTSIALNVHICYLVERLVRKTPIETRNHLEEFEQNEKNFIKAVRQSFSDILDHYNVDIPVSEIAYIKDYIDNSQEVMEW